MIAGTRCWPLTNIHCLKFKRQAHRMVPADGTLSNTLPRVWCRFHKRRPFRLPPPPRQIKSRQEHFISIHPPILHFADKISVGAPIHCNAVFCQRSLRPKAPAPVSISSSTNPPLCVCVGGCTIIQPLAYMYTLVQPLVRSPCRRQATRHVHETASQLPLTPTATVAWSRGEPRRC